MPWYGWLILSVALSVGVPGLAYLAYNGWKFPNGGS